MSDEGVTAGRGVIYITLAKLYFMVAGYAIVFVLPRLLGSKVEWGNYLLVTGLVSVIDNVIVVGTIQGVSRFTAQGDVGADAVKRAGLHVLALVGTTVVAIYVLAAPWIARALEDGGLTQLCRLSAGIIISYALYAVFVGSVNGLRQFGRQAVLDSGYATLRCALILGCAAAGWGVFGAISGWVTAAASMVVLAALWVGLPRTTERFPRRRLWSFMARLLLYTFAINMIMRIDLLLLKRFVTHMASGSAEARAAQASTFAAYYGTAQLMAFIPYQAILSVTFVIFPLVSRSTFESDLAATRRYVHQTLRLSALFVSGLAVVFIANPEAVIAVLYPTYRLGGPALRVLAAGIVCFSLFVIINTILNGGGRTRETITSALLTFVAAAGFNALAVPGAPTMTAALQRAAYATSGAMALGLVFSTVALYRAYGAAFPPLSIARLVISAGVAVTVGHFIPEVSRLVTIGECALVFFTYAATLVLLREIDRAELGRLAGALRRKP